MDRRKRVIDLATRRFKEARPEPQSLAAVFEWQRDANEYIDECLENEHLLPLGEGINERATYRHIPTFPFS